MKLEKSKLIYSPTDLSTFFRSPYVSWLHHFNLSVSKEERVVRQEDATQELLAKKGNEFEVQEIQKRKKDKSLKVVDISRDNDFEKAHKETLQALKGGADIVYQAALQIGEFEGYADFLIKVPGKKSNLGDFSYEIWDTKLSHSAKPEYALQLCCYSEMLAELQGHWPEKWHLILGDGTTSSFPVSDYRFYYQYFKNVFLRFHKEFSLQLRPFPEPWENVTGYDDHVEEIYKASDHLCLVAGVTLGQIKRLGEMKIGTRADLAKATDKQRPRRMQPQVFERIREQARLQIESEKKKEIAFRVLDHDKGESRGLARIPETDDGDVIFDMEGYPFEKDGFEYLYGILVREKGKWIFKEWTAHEPTEEQGVYERFIDWLIAHHKKHPSMHVYHYAAYEPVALARLSNKYSTRVAEIDHLLRCEAFVDLYKVVREGVRVGTPSYSIKKVEAVYGFKRKSEVTTAGDSVVQFYNYLELKVVDAAAAKKVLSDIVEYNKEDVESTLGLLGWLREQKQLNKVKTVLSQSKPVAESPTPDWELARRDLVEHPPKWVKKTNAEDVRVNELIGDLAGFFHREDRPVWWAFFQRQNSLPEDLFDDAECLAMAKVVKSSAGVCQITFDPDQALKIKAGSTMNIHGGEFRDIAKIEEIDINAGTAKLSKCDLPKGTTLTLIPGGPIPTGGQKTILVSLATDWKSQAPSSILSEAALDLLYRRAPRLKGVKHGNELYAEDEETLDATLRIAKDLKNSCLSIQGPPGTGKTFTGGYVIASLLKEGKRIAVVSQGKKSIEKLLSESVNWWRKLYPKIPLPNILMADNDGGGEEPVQGLHYCTNSAAVTRQRTAQLLGATHWVFAKPDLQDQGFDYLFVDEAGQFSLAATIICSFTAKNIVLLGDQMQLEQVNVGAHPGESGLSVLNYYMREFNTVPRTHGVFLGETWRLNPEISDLISHLVYDNRLKSNKRTKDHELALGTGKSKLIPNGILFYPVDHAHNSMRSEEEADAIEDIIKELRLSKVPDKDGKQKKFELNDENLIVISPYNAQVELIRSRVNGVRVGSVDLFQGQEAWVSVLSMCASGEEGLHRGLEFLLSKNRMNVGLSRAKALSIVVGSPRLLEIRPKRLDTIPLLNFYAALMKI